MSILTPVWADTPDKVAWLAEGLESLEKQTLTDWEAIIIDDASPLSLDAVKQRFGGDRFRFLRTSSRFGPARCRNTAAALAESEALLALDADDALADENVLGDMLEAWKQDRRRVVYGDVQRLKVSEGQFRRERIFNLPSYTFQRALDLNGIIPVTALHARECHATAGGWKPELEAGLEDVEYWIAAGKAGYCGHRISRVTLLYRRHDQSRAFKMRRVDRRESEMRNLIREMHKDVYEGRFPMGCCGGGGRRSGGNPAASRRQPAQAVSRTTTLDQYPSAEKVWVQYQGKRRAAFGMVGQFTKYTYQVEGPGHKLEVHVNDVSRFKRSGRGKDFAVAVAPPPGQEPPPEPLPEPERYSPPAVQLAELERLDRVAMGRGEMTPASREELPQEPPQEVTSLNVLNLGNLQAMLEAEGWTVESLATAGVGELMSYKGIGPVRAAQIINRAKEATDVDK